MVVMFLGKRNRLLVPSRVLMLIVEKVRDVKGKVAGEGRALRVLKKAIKLCLCLRIIKD